MFHRLLEYLEKTRHPHRHESEEVMLDYGQAQRTPTNLDSHMVHRFSAITTRYRTLMTHSFFLLLWLLLIFFWRRVQRQCPDLPYSPANVAIEYQQDLTTFNGSFDFPSIYRGDPTPQVDDAWFRISTGIRTTRLTLEQLRKIGKEDTLSKVKYQEADGGGYIAAVEFSHQLHCLNLLRKYVHFDYYGQSDPFFTESRPETYQRHLEHCIEALRQALMCSADTGMITFEWVRGFSMPYPDFNTKHRCRDFEKLVAWQTANGVNDVPLDRIVRLNEEVDLIDVPRSSEYAL